MHAAAIEMTFLITSILLPICLIIYGVKGNDICKNLYKEFSLDDGYNKNIEPPVDLVITDKQKVHDIEKVKCCIF